MLSRLKIDNILAIQHLDIEPSGHIMEITGGNAAAKTSIVKSIFATIEGGHDARLIRNGSDAGEIVMVLDGDTIKRRITQDRSTPTVAGAKEKHQSRIEELVDLKAANPIEFLQAKDEAARIEWIYETMPLTISREEIEAAIGRKWNGSVEGHALNVIAGVYKLVETERRLAGRLAKEKTTTATELFKTLPPAQEAAVDIAALNAEYQAKLEEKRTRESFIELTRLEKIQEHRNKATSAAAKANEEAEKAIADIRAKQAERVAKINEQLGTLVEALEVQVKEVSAADAEKFRPELESLSSRISVATEGVKNAERAKMQRELYDRTNAEATKLQQEWQEWQDAAGNLVSLKGKLTAKLPIKGLEIRDGEIYYEGCSLYHQNDAERYKVAIKLALARRGKLVVVDGLERFEPKNRAALWQVAAKFPDVQFVFTRVTEGPLTIDGKAVSTTAEVGA